MIPTYCSVSYTRQLILGCLCILKSKHIYFPVYCLNLTDPDNGMIRCSFGGDAFANVGDTCTYTCDTGYMLNGMDIRVCQSDSVWNGTDPLCGKGNVNVMFLCFVNYIKPFQFHVLCLLTQ